MILTCYGCYSIEYGENFIITSLQYYCTHGNLNAAPCIKTKISILHFLKPCILCMYILTCTVSMHVKIIDPGMCKMQLCYDKSFLNFVIWWYVSLDYAYGRNCKWFCSQSQTSVIKTKNTTYVHLQIKGNHLWKLQFICYIDLVNLPYWVCEVAVLFFSKMYIYRFLYSVNTVFTWLNDAPQIVAAFE